MKKIKLLSLLLIFLVIFVGCGKNGDEYLEEISYNKFKEMLENKETFFFEIIQTGCSYCKAFTPKLEEVLEENKIKGYQLNMSNMTEKEYEEFDKMFEIEGTPTTIFIENGKETSKMERITENVSKNKIIAKLKTNGYIKK